MQLFSIRDRLAHEFAPPFVAKNDEVALRSARQMFQKIPPSNDFELYLLGEFDGETGLIKSCKPSLISNELCPQFSAMQGINDKKTV